MQSSKTDETVDALSDGACSSRTDSSAPCTEAYPDDAVSLRLSSSLTVETFDVPLDTVACTDSAPSSTSTFVKEEEKQLSYNFVGGCLFPGDQCLEGLESNALFTQKKKIKIEKRSAVNLQDHRWKPVTA